jgi:hypothetical protein
VERSISLVVQIGGADEIWLLCQGSAKKRSEKSAPRTFKTRTPYYAGDMTPEAFQIFTAVVREELKLVG